MVYRWKELLDVEVQEVVIFSGKVLGAGTGTVGAFAFSIGIRIKDKAALKSGFDQVA